MKKNKIKVLCEYCAKLVPVEVSANAEVLLDCPSCGAEVGLYLEIKCDICKHTLYKETDDGDTPEITVKELK